jgi:hypothetical protein
VGLRAAPVPSRIERTLALLSEAMKRRPQDEVAASLEREAAGIISQLKDELRREPARWRPLVEALGSAEDVRILSKVADLLRESVDGAAEAPLLKQLEAGSPVRVRRASLFLLSNRDSDVTLAALVGVALEDPDASLRRTALQALAARKAREGSSPVALRIDAAIRRMAAADPEESVRDMARRMSGESPVTPPSAPIPARGRLAGRPSPEKGSPGSP